MIQVVLIAESSRLQQLLATYGIPTQTPHQVEPIQIWSPKELSKAYEYLGVNKKLDLTGRPKRPFGVLSTSKVCSHSTEINQLINQYTNQSINQSINQYTNQSVSQSINIQINQLISQSINLQINQSVMQNNTLLVFKILKLVYRPGLKIIKLFYAQLN